MDSDEQERLAMWLVCLALFAVFAWSFAKLLPKRAQREACIERCVQESYAP